MERVYLTAVAIDKGIIAVIMPNGTISYFRQRGISKLHESYTNKLVEENKLASNWENYIELPNYMSIAFEDEVIMGKARASFPIDKQIISALPIKKKKVSSNKCYKCYKSLKRAKC
jgi:hypothetical protein